MDVTSLPETLDPLVIAVAILSNPSGELEEADETETSSGHWRQCLVSNRVAETLSPQEGNVIPLQPVGGNSSFSTPFKIWKNN